MRRNRGATVSTPKESQAIIQPSTPIQLNQNSNSCSNDTMYSSASHSNQINANSNNNAIVQNEIKIRSLLKELQNNVVRCQQERDKNEPNLTVITKTHEKVRKERNELSTFYRKKLRTLYQSTINESDDEINCLRQSLDCINQVRLAQNEIRLLQQQNSAFSSPTLLNGHSPNSSHRVNQNESFLDSKLTSNMVPKKLSTVTMRRGVLMSILQQAAFTLPLWVGEISEDAPALCGSIPPEDKYVCKPGDKVAALVKSSNSASNTLTNAKTISPDDEDDEENWILAEVVEYNASTSNYDVDDIDAEEGQERYTLSKKCVVPLPLWRANPLTDPDAIFPKDSLVLALYPQTTCFYRGVISEAPTTPQEDYLILFEDNTYVEGYSPPLNVPQLYVVAFDDKR